MKELVIFGAWYLSRVVTETAQATGWKVLGYVDPEPPENVLTLKTLPDTAAFFVAIGDNSIREVVTSRLVEHGRRIATIVHPMACVSPSAVIDNGSYVAEFAVVRANSTVGKGVMLQAGSVVSHDCQVGSFATLGPNAATTGRVKVGQRTLVGVGASIAPQVMVGDDCIIAAGAAVYRNCEDKTTILGNPATARPNSKKATNQSDWQLNKIW